MAQKDAPAEKCTSLSQCVCNSPVLILTERFVIVCEKIGHLYMVRWEVSELYNDVLHK